MKSMWLTCGGGERWVEEEPELEPAPPVQAPDLDLHRCADDVWFLRVEAA